MATGVGFDQFKLVLPHAEPANAVQYEEGAQFEKICSRRLSSTLFGTYRPLKMVCRLGAVGIDVRQDDIGDSDDYRINLLLKAEV